MFSFLQSRINGIKLEQKRKREEIERERERHHSHTGVLLTPAAVTQDGLQNTRDMQGRVSEKTLG